MAPVEIREIFAKNEPGTWQDDARIFWLLSRPYFWSLIAAVVCGAILSGINGAIAWLVKPALDSFFTEKSSLFVVLLPIGVIILFSMRGVFTYLTNYLMSSIGAKIVRTLRRELYDKLLSLPVSFYTKTTSGSLVSKLLNDLGTLHATVAYTIKDFFVEGGTVVVLALVAISRRWDLALLSFVVIPLMIYSIGRLGTVMKRTSMKTRKLISQVTTILHETLQGMKIIKAFTMEREMSVRHEQALNEHYRNTMREVRIDEFSRLVAEVLGGVGVAIILLYGSHLVMSEKISAGSFFSFVAAVLMIYTPLKRLSKVYNNFQQARTVVERIKEVLLVEAERPGGIEKPIKGEIVLDNVSFAYPSTKNHALRDISLTIPRGEIVALVGHSGAGKSTLVDLLGGFWVPTEGAVFIDGTNINDLSLVSLRRHMGMVTQDVVLFNDTIKANIHFGRPDATDEEVEEAAKAAYAHEFIRELPEGYGTRIGERGVMLSGGQKQRITIARAILRNPAILLLDEATSSLDAESEQKVQEALERLMVGRTTIVIAHRLSTIKKASRIVVMNRGEVVQQGSHEDLLLQGGLYQELYALQFETPGTVDTTLSGQIER